ncbi:MAG: protein-disulfide reductase DsbD family protein, partial [Prevotellaceae bacterium]|nr:protein-disulfide reductase DsbD family protein [Prevotellaceae bacterium]
KMKIHPGYHIYAVVSDKDPYIENTYDISFEGDGKLSGDLQKPAGRLLNSTGTVVFEGEQVFRQKFTAKDNGTVSFTINYQACDNHSCLQPMSKTVKTRF